MLIEKNWPIHRPGRVLAAGLGLALIAAAMALLPSPKGGAGQGVVPVGGPPFYYAVKFVCGTVVDGSPESTRVVPADYFTAINVHNPNTVPVTIGKKAVLSPEEPAQGIPSAVLQQLLPPDSAFEVDCPDILTILGPVGPTGSFAKGYVVLFSPLPLDVHDVETNSRALAAPTAGVGQGLDLQVVDGATFPPPPPNPIVVNNYSVKYLCGAVVASPGPVVPGTYRSAVNIHNPNLQDAVLLKKAVRALPEPGLGKPGGFVSFVLKPDGAFEIGCADILSLLGPTAPVSATGTPCGAANLTDPACFVKGFVVIESHSVLDVVDVNTAERVSASPQGVGLGIDKERVQAIQETGTEIDYFPMTSAGVTITDNLGNLVDTCALQGPTAIRVRLAPIVDATGLDHVDTEMLSMSLQGTCQSGAPVTLVQSPTLPSTGRISQQLGGPSTSLVRCDNPNRPATSQYDSFFDVFFEVSVSGTPFHNIAAARVSDVIPCKPPPDGAYCGTNRVQLFDRNGVATPFFIGDRCHFPHGVIFQERDVNNTGQQANDLHKFFDQKVGNALVLNPPNCTAGGPAGPTEVSVKCASPQVIPPGGTMTLQITSAGPGNATLLYECWTLNGTTLQPADPRCPATFP